MSKAIYPGSFDPMTNGHLDVIQRALKIFDEIIVAVADNPGKQSLFTKEERKGMIKEVVKPYKKVKVDSFDLLLVEYVRSKKLHIILRGIRTVSDFEFEYQMALTNRTFASDIETVFVMTHEEYSYISSKLIKEAAAMGGDVGKFVPKEIEKHIRQKFQQKK